MGHIDPQRLVGAWQLERWEIAYGDGTASLPFGPDAAGLLLYTADGWMSASIMTAGRARLSRANPRAAPEAERAAAFDGYFSYCGRWRMDGESVQHDVTIALNPAFVGVPQVRAVLLQDRTLTLSAEEAGPGGIRVHRLRWRRPGILPRGDHSSTIEGATP